MQLPEVTLRLPEWVSPLLRERFGDGPAILEAIEARARLAIDLSRRNIDEGTGGPFGAAVFERDSGRLIAVGVNLVLAGPCSTAHAEIVALSLAQRLLETHNLSAPPLPAHELVTSCEPCAMCLGAVPWSGVRRLICCARDEDARSVGFDEGDKPPDWVRSLEHRTIAVVRDVLREPASEVLQAYVRSGGEVY